MGKLFTLWTYRNPQTPEETEWHRNKLEVKNFKIDDIHPYENNPRFNKDAVSKVAASSTKGPNHSIPILAKEERISKA